MKQKNSFRTKKNLGQNFLVDKNILRIIIEQANISKDDTVLEIGAGQGVLTRELAACPCRHLYSVEIDTTLSGYLDDISVLYPDSFSLLWGDALLVDYTTLLPAPTKVIANIPYNITTPLIWRLIEQLPKKGTKYFLLMVQKEAADRINASPATKERYPLGITLEIMGVTRSIRTVSPQSFRPVPAVTSALLEIRLSGEHLGLPGDLLWRNMLRSAFAQRRKKLCKNLRSLRFEICWEDLFQESGIEENARAEELTTRQWLTLRAALDRFEKKGLSPE